MDNRDIIGRIIDYINDKKSKSGYDDLDHDIVVDEKEWGELNEFIGKMSEELMRVMGTETRNNDTIVYGHRIKLGEISYLIQ